DAEVRRVLDLLDEAGIGLTTIAPSKGGLPQTPIAERRLALGLGEDGQRDYWSPYGDGDLLRRTWQLAFTNGFRRDEDIEGCLDIASRGGAQIMAGARPDGSALTEDARFGLAVGAPADFVLLEADTVTSAIMDCPSDRDVFRSGELIASGGQLLGGVRLSCGSSSTAADRNGERTQPDEHRARTEAGQPDAGPGEVSHRAGSLRTVSVRGVFGFRRAARVVSTIRPR